MSEYYQCPYKKIRFCTLKVPCIDCDLKSEFLKAQVETPSVSDNETKKKLCEFYPKECNYNTNFDCPYLDDDDVVCYEH